MRIKLQNHFQALESHAHFSHINENLRLNKMDNISICIKHHKINKLHVIYCTRFRLYLFHLLAVMLFQSMDRINHTIHQRININPNYSIFLLYWYPITIISNRTLLTLQVNQCKTNVLQFKQLLPYYCFQMLILIFYIKLILLFS